MSRKSSISERGLVSKARLVLAGVVVAMSLGAALAVARPDFWGGGSPTAFWGGGGNPNGTLRADFIGPGI
jgi:hypothetical protein